MVEGLKIRVKLCTPMRLMSFRAEIAPGEVSSDKAIEDYIRANVRYGMASCWDVQNGY